MHAEEDAESSRQTTVTTAKRDQYFRTGRNTANPGGRAVLRRGSAAARLLGLWFRIPPGAWISVFC